MSDVEPPEIEDESLASSAARRRKQFRHAAEEFAMAIIFLAAFFAADHLAGIEKAPPPLAVVGMAVVAAVLVFWLLLHVRRFKALDEFERSVELRSLALAGGCAILFAATWGGAEIVLGAPEFPLIMLAPLYSAIYAIARLRISRAFQ